MSRGNNHEDPETYEKVLEFQAVITFRAKTDEYGDEGIAAVMSALSSGTPIDMDSFWDESCSIRPTDYPRIMSMSRDVVINPRRS